MTQPLTIPNTVSKVRVRLLEMSFEVDKLDEQGNVIGKEIMKASGKGIDELSNAIGKAMYDVLKDISIIGTSAVGGPIKGQVE